MLGWMRGRRRVDRVGDRMLLRAPFPGPVASGVVPIIRVSLSRRVVVPVREEVT